MADGPNSGLGSSSPTVVKGFSPPKILDNYAECHSGAAPETKETKFSDISITNTLVGRDDATHHDAMHPDYMVDHNTQSHEAALVAARKLPPPPPPSRFADQKNVGGTSLAVTTTPTITTATFSTIPSIPPGYVARSVQTRPEDDHNSEPESGSPVVIDDIDDDWESDWPRLMRGFSGLTSPSNPPQSQSQPRTTPSRPLPPTPRSSVQMTTTTISTASNTTSATSAQISQTPRNQTSYQEPITSLAQIAREAAAVGHARAVARAERRAALANPNTSTLPSVENKTTGQHLSTPATHFTMTPKRSNFVSTNRYRQPRDASRDAQPATSPPAAASRGLAESLWSSLPTFNMTLNPVLSVVHNIPSWPLRVKNHLATLLPSRNTESVDASPTINSPLVTRDSAGRLQFSGCPCACHVAASEMSQESKQVDGLVSSAIEPTHCCRCVTDDAVRYLTSALQSTSTESKSCVSETKTEVSPKPDSPSPPTSFWDRIDRNRVAATVIPAALALGLVLYSKRSSGSQAPPPQTTVMTVTNVPGDRITTAVSTEIGWFNRVLSYIPWKSKSTTVVVVEPQTPSQITPQNGGPGHRASRLRESVLRAAEKQLESILLAMRETSVVP